MLINKIFRERTIDNYLSESVYRYSIEIESEVDLDLFFKDLIDKKVDIIEQDKLTKMLIDSQGTFCAYCKKETT